LDLFTNRVLERRTILIENTLTDISKANYELTKRISLCFRYDGITYFNDAVRVGRPVLLHPSLHSRMDNYIKTNNDNQLDNARVRAVIKKALNMSRNAADIFKIIPSVLHEVMSDHVYGVAKKETPILTESAVRTFNERNKPALLLIQEAHLLNILME
jgi:hypothetical protein